MLKRKSPCSPIFVFIGVLLSRHSTTTSLSVVRVIFAVVYLIVQLIVDRIVILSFISSTYVSVLTLCHHSFRHPPLSITQHSVGVIAISLFNMLVLSLSVNLAINLIVNLVNNVADSLFISLSISLAISRSQHSFCFIVISSTILLVTSLRFHCQLHRQSHALSHFFF